MDKPRGHRGAKHCDAEPAVRQRLVVIRDRFVVGGNAERARDIQSILALRQLPQASEQPLRVAAREHDCLAIGQPQRGAREHR